MWSSIRSLVQRNTAVALVVGMFFGASAVTCSQPKSAESGGTVHGGVSGVSMIGNMLAPSPVFAQTGASSDVTLADIAEKAVPSVVNISATRVVRGTRPQHPLARDPFFREFFGPFPNVPQERMSQSLGSGVIVSKDGVILTNNHVVAQAEEIQVTLSDGREFGADVVGTDPKSDLAVVRLEGDVSGLEPLPFGNSAATRLGDVVLAIGNPFGVGQTVTMGIVSATGRSRVGIVDYEDFIQTDAAINPGNSGGALVNMRGELVGINTAILSRTGGYQGIGFAIPSDMARPIMKSLLEDGKVDRGWLGVVIQDLDKDLSQALQIPNGEGVLISDVAPDSPAAKAGLQRGDVVIEMDGQPATSTSRFRNRVAAHEPGSKVSLVVLRDGKKKQVSVTLGTLAKSPLAQSNAEIDDSGLLSGITVANLSADIRAKYNIPERITQGVLVTSVQPGSSADKARLRKGDVILELNRESVDSVAEFQQLHRKAKDSVLLLVYRDGATLYLALKQ